MKSCMIHGDMMADGATDQYPTVAICDACVEAEQQKGEDSCIITVADYDPSSGDSCVLCDEPL